MLAQRDVSVVYARLLLQAELLPERELLSGSGLTPQRLSHDEYIRWSELATLIRNIQATAPQDAWAAKLGVQFGMSPHGSLGFAALSAPTLGAALEAIVELLAVRVSAISVELERRDGRYYLRLFDRGEIPDIFDAVCELTLKTIEALVATILGHSPARRCVIYLSRQEPAANTELKQVFQSKLIFDTNQNAVSIPAELWRQASPLHDNLAYQSNLLKCRELLAARQQQATMAHAVRAKLTNHFELQSSRRVASSPPDTLAELAQEMHLTPRTLIRRLNAEQQSYKSILRDMRREYARSLLANAALTVAEVGEILGYREPANFGRAFRAWYGTSPSAWRRSGQ